MFKRVTLERTMCFGTCPVYRIEIDSAGKVIWEGKKYVAKPGRHEWTIPKEKIDELNSAIDKFGYKNYKYNTIDGPNTDFPSAITSVLFDNGYLRKISHYLGDTLKDNRLTEFENEIDRIAGTEDYIHGNSSETMARKVSNIFLRYPCSYYWGISPQFDDRQGRVSSQSIGAPPLTGGAILNTVPPFPSVYSVQSFLPPLRPAMPESPEGIYYKLLNCLGRDVYVWLKNGSELEFNPSQFSQESASFLGTTPSGPPNWVTSKTINISDVYAVLDCNDYEGFNKVWTERYIRYI